MGYILHELTLTSGICHWTDFSMVPGARMGIEVEVLGLGPSGLRFGSPSLSSPIPILLYAFGAFRERSGRARQKH